MILEFTQTSDEARLAFSKRGGKIQIVGKFNGALASRNNADSDYA